MRPVLEWASQSRRGSRVYEIPVELVGTEFRDECLHGSGFTQFP